MTGSFLPFPMRGRALAAAFLCALLWAAAAGAAPYAAMVMDARTGQVLHARNADARLHPASLTKMMTLYIAFQAVEHGEISLDSVVTVSRNAAAEPPSRLGLRAGQKIRLRYLIRAAAIKSANDAATAIAEAIGGSEAAFVRRMNRTARALGMTRTTFRNANGLTAPGHLSTARDMTILGRHLIYDFPQYYNLFSRRSADAGVRRVANTNRRLLAAYPGADGIKTGYTRAAGFNLVASARRGSKRIIATVFGGRSSASRNREVMRLLDLGFRKAPARVPVRKPTPPDYALLAGLPSAPASSPRPLPRPRPGIGAPEAVTEAIVASVAEEVSAAVESLRGVAAAVAGPPPRPTRHDGPRMAEVTPREPVVVTRVSTSGGRNWGVNVGLYATRYEAEKRLLTTALMELETLGQALRKVARSPRGWEANFVGMNEDVAQLACARLRARQERCEVLEP